MSQKSQHEGVTRRQFLNYTLTGVGGFLVAGVTAPMLGFAIDPVLKPRKERDMVAVGNVSELSTEPKRFNFRLPVKDGWAEYDISLSAWVMLRQDGNILALSPICKHLGCTVTWGHERATRAEHFFCPCHNGYYTKDGINVPGTPPLGPLDVYRYEVGDDGTLYLGQAVSREEL
jgi:menaquinol-cytochrome c reductase iron-sulfur subunit